MKLKSCLPCFLPLSFWATFMSRACPPPCTEPSEKVLDEATGPACSCFLSWVMPSIRYLGRKSKILQRQGAKLQNSLDSNCWRCWCFVVFNLIRVIASINTLQRRVLWVSSVYIGAAVFSFITSKSIVFYLAGRQLAPILLGEKEGGNGELSASRWFSLPALCIICLDRFTSYLSPLEHSPEIWKSLEFLFSKLLNGL